MNKLGTKAETLQTVYKNLKLAEALPQCTFIVGEWKADFEKIMNDFQLLDWNARVIVRSGFLAEDTSDRIVRKRENMLESHGLLRDRLLVVPITSEEPSSMSSIPKTIKSTTESRWSGYVLHYKNLTYMPISTIDI